MAVLDSARKVVMEAILETKAETILQFLRGLRGSLYVTLEEGTWAAWLHDLLQPHVIFCGKPLLTGPSTLVTPQPLCD